VTIAGIFLIVKRATSVYWKTIFPSPSTPLSCDANNYRAFELKGKLFPCPREFGCGKGKLFYNRFQTATCRCIHGYNSGGSFLQQAKYIEAIKYFGEVLIKTRRCDGEFNCARRDVDAQGFPQRLSFICAPSIKTPLMFRRFTIWIRLREMKSYPSAEYYFSRVLRYKPDHFAVFQLDTVQGIRDKLRK